MSRSSPRRLLTRAGLALRVWRTYVTVRRGRATGPLPGLVAALGRPPRRPRAPEPPPRLAHAVHRALRVGRRRPTCLVSSLVLYRLLVAQGDRPALVIGLPATPTDRDAHAWVELGGRDVGPPPGGYGHQPMVRYGPGGASAAAVR